MLLKEEVINNVRNMPDAFSIDELVERLLFVEAVEHGIQEDDRNEVLTTEQLKSKLGR